MTCNGIWDTFDLIVWKRKILTVLKSSSLLTVPSKFQCSMIRMKNVTRAHQKKTILLDIFKNFSLFVKLPDQIFKLCAELLFKVTGIGEKMDDW
jgi:hypothetical protein